MSEKKKLLFIYPQLYTFVKTDLELLSDKFQIISFNQKWSSKYLLPFNLIVQFFYLLFNLVKGGYHINFFWWLSFFAPSIVWKDFQ